MRLPPEFWSEIADSHWERSTFQVADVLFEPALIAPIDLLALVATACRTPKHVKL